MDGNSTTREKPGSGVSGNLGDSGSLGRNPAWQFWIVPGKAWLGRFGKSREMPGRGPGGIILEGMILGVAR